MADEAAEECADIEADEREVPEAGDHFCSEAFAGAGDADERDAFGRGQAVVAGFFGKGFLALPQPRFEHFEPADIGNRLLRREELECAGLADDALFFRRDHINAAFVKRAGGFGDDALRRLDFGDDAFADDALGLVRREAECGAQDFLAAKVGELHFDLRVLHKAVEDAAHLFDVRRRELHEENVVAQIIRHLRAGRGDDDRLARGFKRVGEVAELAGDDGLIVQAVVKILEHEDGIAVALGLGNGFEGGLRVPRIGHRSSIFADGFEIRGNVPSHEAAIRALTQSLQRGDDAVLLI